MPNTTQEVLYAVVGAGDLVIEKVRSATNITDRSATQQRYADFVKRGHDLSKKIKNSAPSKQALAQTKTARAQVKGATTSFTKAVQANAKGTRKAAAQTKVAQTQIKAAATSVSKAVRANAKATRAAAEKVLKAS